MNASLRDRILRRIETLPDDRGYQVLDYVEFLESKYAERQAPSPSIFQRFADGVEDTLRAGKVSTAAVVETMSLMNKAMGVLGGVAAAGKSMASDFATAASAATKSATGSAPPVAGTSTTPPQSIPAPPEPSAPPNGGPPAPETLSPE
ncbi:MAG: DUF2281 domain-containing protein [Gemmatimonadaceae bacterium]